MHHLILNRSMAPSTMNRAQQLLAGLQATGDESRQLQVLSQLFGSEPNLKTCPGCDRDVPTVGDGE